uniref:Uncharacterized protein n=1 Tax=Chenopodium quinoa TaxID=63459 RepID=A0A803MEK4_CHEQI
MTAGLPQAYAGKVDFIQNQEPLPSFESCRSRLKLAERTIKNRLAKEGGATSRQPTALVTSTNQQPTDSSGNSNRSNNRNNKQKKSTTKSYSKGRNTGPTQQQAGPPWQPWQFQQVNEMINDQITFTDSERFRDGGIVSDLISCRGRWSVRSGAKGFGIVVGFDEVDF